MKLPAISLDNMYTLLLSAIAFTIPLTMLANNIAIIVFIIFWLFLCFKKQINVPNMRPLMVLLIPYGIIIFGAFYTSDYKQLGIELTKNLPFLILPIVIFTAPFKIDVAHFRMILKSFVLGNFIISAILVSIIIKSLIIGGFSLESLFGVTHQKLSDVVGLNAIYLSLFFAIGVLSIIYDFLYEGKEKSIILKFFYIIVLFLLFVVLVFLSSRTVIISCSILITILLFQYYLKRVGFFKTFLRSFLIIGMMSIIVFSINPILKMRVESVFFKDSFDENELKEEGVRMRQKLWESSYKVFIDNILFGVGTGDFKEVLLETYKSNKHRVQYRFQMNSHNQYLSYMVSSGIFGIVLFLYYMFYPLSKYAKEKRGLLLLITLLFMFCFVTESYLYTNKGVVVVSFFITLMYKHYLDTKSQFQNEKT